MTKKVAIIQFPGSNCEYETLQAFKSLNIPAEIVSWNASNQYVASFHAFVLPGGFSFQDRVRAGVVSSSLPILKNIKKAAGQGIPVLGICNGCQILAEAGILPQLDTRYSVEMALAPNMKNGQYHGFVCDWVFVKVSFPQHSIFTTYFSEEDVIPIPINHGEGNFVFRDQEGISQSSLTRFQYCNEKGDIISEYPVNPNGSDLNIAGICNTQGNVLAMMPHPERAMFWYHIPRYLHHDAAADRRKGIVKPGPWEPLFRSLGEFINEN